MLNMLGLKSVMTLKTRFRAMNRFMAFAALLAMVQVATASKGGTVGGAANPSASIDDRVKIKRSFLPPKRKATGWLVGCILSLLALLAALFLPHFSFDNFDYDGISSTLMITSAVAAGVLGVTCMYQWKLSSGINSAIEEYGAPDNKMSEEDFDNQVIRKTTLSRNISFIFAIVAILASIILAASLFGMEHIDGERLGAKTMNAATCLTLFTVGIGFMTFVVPYKGAPQTESLTLVDKCGKGGRYVKNKVMEYLGNHNGDEEITWRGFLFKSKSFYLSIFLIVGIIMLGTNVFGGADGFGNSQITKIAMMGLGGAMLGAIVIGAAFRVNKFYNREDGMTYDEWKSSETKSELTIWGTSRSVDLTKILQVLVLITGLVLAVVLTVEGSIYNHFAGQGGQTLATVWILFMFAVFGGIRLGLDYKATCESKAKRESHPPRPQMSAGTKGDSTYVDPEAPQSEEPTPKHFTKQDTTTSIGQHEEFEAQNKGISSDADSGVSQTATTPWKNWDEVIKSAPGIRRRMMRALSTE